MREFNVEMRINFREKLRILCASRETSQQARIHAPNVF